MNEIAHPDHLHRPSSGRPTPGFRRSTPRPTSPPDALSVAMANLAGAEIGFEVVSEWHTPRPRVADDPGSRPPHPDAEAA